MTFIALIFYPLLTGHTEGEKWIEAVNKDSTHLISKQHLTLRKNGNFTIEEDRFIILMLAEYVNRESSFNVPELMFDHFFHSLNRNECRFIP